MIEPPLIPTNITAYNKSPYSLHLSWDQEGDILPQYYKVIHSPDDVHYTMNKPRAAITGLRPYTVYTFTVQAYNAAGIRGDSEPLQTRTGMLHIIHTHRHSTHTHRTYTLITYCFV